MEIEANSDRTGGAIDAGLGGQVRSTVARLYRRFRSERPEGSLGDAALDVLIWLHKTGPQTLTELSERGQVAPASMSQSINRLTSAGYVVRSPDPNDGRKVLIRTTPDGAEFARATRAKRDAWLEARLRTLSHEDQQTLARACALLTCIAES